MVIRNLIIVSSILLSACASKNHTSVPVAQLNIPKKIVYIQEKQQTLPPYGYVQFCRDNKSECSTSQPILRTSPERTAATSNTNTINYTIPKGIMNASSHHHSQTLALLDSVNKQVNESITQVTDDEGFGVPELWRIPQLDSIIPDVGDCEDFALAKKKILVDQYGFNPNLLSISVLRRPAGDIHAVLMVRTLYGDIVMDNLNDKLLPWHQTNYQWIKKQSYNNHNQWIML